MYVLYVIIRKGDTMTTLEVRQQVTEYVRSNELQDSDNKRFLSAFNLIHSHHEFE